LTDRLFSLASDSLLPIDLVKESLLEQKAESQVIIPEVSSILNATVTGEVPARKWKKYILVFNARSSIKSYHTNKKMSKEII
jgi:hypothetical protein